MRIGLLTAIVLTCTAGALPAQGADAFATAERVIKDHQLLTQKAQRCSKLMLRDDSNDRIAKLGVYEVHDATCGGDPDIEHRLFDLEIDMKTGAAKWDYNFPDMEMRPVPKRGR